MCCSCHGRCPQPGSANRCEYNQILLQHLGQILLVVGMPSLCMWLHRSPNNGRCCSCHGRCPQPGSANRCEYNQILLQHLGQILLLPERP